MKNMLLILCCIIGLTSCVIPQIGGPNFSVRPSLGMSANDVVQMWGSPARCAFVSVQRTEQLCLWTRRDTLIMPGGYGNATKDTLYATRSVRFLDGRVVGGSF